MYKRLFEEFMASRDTLRVYQGSQLIFSSSENMLVPLIEYLNSVAGNRSQVVIFDKIMGNAAALLSIKAGCSEVFSPLGSELAARTLTLYGVKYSLVEIVPRILRPDGEECPMEKLSRGKTPDEFYSLMRRMVNKSGDS